MTTFAELKSIVKTRLGIENSTHVTDSELGLMLQDSISFVSNKLIDSGQFWNIKTLSFSISSGNTYTLPYDFYKTLKLSYVINSTTQYRLKLVNKVDEDYFKSISGSNFYYDYSTPSNYSIIRQEDGYAVFSVYPKQQAIGNYELEYYYTVPTYTDSDNVILGPVSSPWLETVILHTMRKIATKDEDTTMINNITNQLNETVLRLEAEASTSALENAPPPMFNNWWDDFRGF